METLSQRLSYALRELNVTQADLARRIGVKPQVINFLCKSKTLKSKMTYDIADALGISGEWLASGVGFMRIEENPDQKLISTYNKVPILTYSFLKTCINEGKNYLDFPQDAEYLLTTINAGTQSFAVTLQEKAMYPRFDINTILIINPDKKPKENEFVLVYLKNINDILFRQFYSANEHVTLNPINYEMYKKIQLTDDDLILGTLVEARWQL